jgi:hypothetical protein
MHLLEQRGPRPLRAPAAVECSIVHTGGHEADDLRFHGEPSYTQYVRANTLQTSVQRPRLVAGSARFILVRFVPRLTAQTTPRQNPPIRSKNPRVARLF